MAFDFGRNYMLDTKPFSRLIDVDEEPRGITVHQLMLVSCLILAIHKNAFDFMILREKVAKSLEVEVGEITIADMQSAIDQLHSKKLIKRTKSFNWVGCPGLGKALRKLLVF